MIYDQNKKARENILTKQEEGEMIEKKDKDIAKTNKETRRKNVQKSTSRQPHEGHGSLIS